MTAASNPKRSTSSKEYRCSICGNIKKIITHDHFLACRYSGRRKSTGCGFVTMLAFLTLLEASALTSPSASFFFLFSFSSLNNLAALIA
jgi:hypothetical protein